MAVGGQKCAGQYAANVRAIHGVPHVLGLPVSRARFGFKTFLYGRWSNGDSLDGRSLSGEMQNGKENSEAR